MRICAPNLDCRHSDIVEMLLDAHVAPSTARFDNGALPLHAAAQRGHKHVVELLLAANADPNDPGFADLPYP